MASEFITGLGVFKTLFDMAKGLKDVNDAAVRNGAVVELQEQLITAQSLYATLLSRVGELEEDVARFETWTAEKQRYELKDLERGAFAYVLKPSEARGEPTHAICQACYERRVKSILQFNGEMQHFKQAWLCSNASCKAMIKAGSRALASLTATE